MAVTLKVFAGFVILCTSALARTRHTTTTTTFGRRVALPNPDLVLAKRTNAPNLPTGWSNVGCVSDDAKSPTLSGYTFMSSSMTPSLCASTCGSEGFTYAGTEDSSHCYCSDAVGSESKTATACDAACAGDQFQICGGDQRLSLYASASTSTSTSESTRSTDSSSSRTSTDNNRGDLRSNEIGDEPCLVDSSTERNVIQTRSDLDYSSEGGAVIVQLFEWNWDSVADECVAFIGPAGYGYVQVSPPQESIQGDQWWTSYQAVSYELTSKHGSRDQFADMVQRCHDAGVKVIVDTLFNHMAGIDSGVGTAGNKFTHYDYPAVPYDKTSFHHCGTPGDDISDQNDAWNVQNCELVNLADLATETEYVRGMLAGYANDLMSLGVDGFRLDAAKHIPANDIHNILSRLDTKPAYITQETYFSSGTDHPSDYIINGDAMEFKYRDALKAAMSGAAGGLAGLQDMDNRGWLPSSSANVFVTNHDSDREDSAIKINAPNNEFINANVFMLAHPYGHPTIHSSFSYQNKDEGSPNGGAGTCNGNGGAGGFNCEHRNGAIAGMTVWRNNVGSEAISNWVSQGSGNQVAFSRGAVGFVAINNADGDWTSFFTTGMPDGRYCDIISGNGACDGMPVDVSNGQATITIPARASVAIHTGKQM